MERKIFNDDIGSLIQKIAIVMAFIAIIGGLFCFVVGGLVYLSNKDMIDMIDNIYADSEWVKMGLKALTGRNVSIYGLLGGAGLFFNSILLFGFGKMINDIASIKHRNAKSIEPIDDNSVEELPDL